jgi:hypothetical protein
VNRNLKQALQAPMATCKILSDFNCESWLSAAIARAQVESIMLNYKQQIIPQINEELGYPLGPIYGKSASLYIIDDYAFKEEN